MSDRGEEMKQQESKNAQSIWNLPELLARVDNDQQLLRDLLAIFREDCPGHICSLEKAIAAGDLKSAAAEHTR
jgi:HPt (histidine-containing phosphotransfer) domain-containing protein